jgi:hypothetical protein
MRFFTRVLLVVGMFVSSAVAASADPLPASAPASTVSYRAATRQVVVAAPRARRVYYRRVYRGNRYVIR